LLGLLDPTNLVASSGYIAIFLLSVLQSCCVPTSSELTLGFGGVLASQGKLSLAGVIAAGVSGEVVGAYIAWIIGRTGGRTIVDRYGRYLWLSTKDLDRAEAWYHRHSRWGVFGSRLLPVVRNFVALPAGAAEVPVVRFGLLTLAGSLVWCSAMALIGYALGSSWQSVMHGFSDAGYLLAAVAVVAVVLFLFHRRRSYKAALAFDAVDSPTPARGQHFSDPAGPPRATEDLRTTSPGDAAGSPPSGGGQQR
jgi:membrane protein DedA with SNARE-associated domain